ncbi:hypothetical protein EC973_001662 [Apophysomyces ossiformis]|uniref:HMG box domain-containing protein n=1 Tax=Apophysomyces ossiformis TaxID=679940 RepID=A0A8H7BXY5_9FUNG|nr:hypothetical protein EC973_001662 [Apophysomyces ossiformis]
MDICERITTSITTTASTTSCSSSSSSSFPTLTANQLHDLLSLADKSRTDKKRRQRKRAIRRDPNHIPRPVNCFMAYRLEMLKLVRLHCPGANHRDISKVVAKWWGAESKEEKDKYREIASELSKQHAAMYPNYKYRPNQSRRLTKKREKKLQNKECDHSKVDFTDDAMVTSTLGSLSFEQHPSVPNHAYYYDRQPYQTKLTSHPVDQEQLHLYEPCDSALYLSYPATMNYSTSSPSTGSSSIYSDMSSSMDYWYSPVCPLLITPFNPADSSYSLFTANQVAAGPATSPVTKWTDQPWDSLHHYPIDDSFAPSLSYNDQ